MSCLVALSIVGCGSEAKLVLIQPHAPQAQQQLRLASDWAFAAGTGAGTQQVLLDFPLPQSVSGPRDFRVFLALPEREGVLPIDPAQPEAGRGFLIQEVGQLRGKTVFSSGTVELTRPLLGGDAWLLKLDVRCEDGTKVAGKATVRPENQELSAFRQAYAADIQLLSPQTQPAHESPTGTLPRQSAKP
ncbi:MAG: hypothetical protein ACKVS9_10740 [Phycisphaerae bacterium]